MNEKKNNDVCPAAVLSMTGELSVSEDHDATLSCLLSDLLDGKYPAVFGHPESFETRLGRTILKELQRRDLILLICIDEFHQYGEGYWETFRPTMMKSSTALRLYGVKNCPSIVMTATATQEEVDLVVQCLGLRTTPIVLAMSPVQSHIKFSIVRRPSNNHGFDGSVNAFGVKSPGLMDLLMRIFLGKYLKDLELGKVPKKCIIFCRTSSMLGELYSRLMELTNFKYRDCRDSPFVMNHSSLLAPSTKVISERSTQISLYLASNKMLLGMQS